MTPETEKETLTFKGKTVHFRSRNYQALDSSNKYLVEREIVDLNHQTAPAILDEFGGKEKHDDHIDTIIS